MAAVTRGQKPHPAPPPHLTPPHPPQPPPDHQQPHRRVTHQHLSNRQRYPQCKWRQLPPDPRWEGQHAQHAPPRPVTSISRRRNLSRVTRFNHQTHRSISAQDARPPRRTIRAHEKIRRDLRAIHPQPKQARPPEKPQQEGLRAVPRHWRGRAQSTSRTFISHKNPPGLPLVSNSPSPPVRSRSAFPEN